MIYIKNPFMLPVIVLVCSVDALLWLICIRFALRKFIADNTFFNAIKQITDFPYKLVQSLYAKYFRKSLPDTACWIMSIAGLIILRQLLMTILV